MEDGFPEPAADGFPAMACSLLQNAEGSKMANGTWQDGRWQNLEDEGPTSTDFGATSGTAI
jgi:hypothetical protein